MKIAQRRPFVLFSGMDLILACTGSGVLLTIPRWLAVNDVIPLLLRELMHGLCHPLCHFAGETKLTNIKAHAPST